VLDVLDVLDVPVAAQAAMRRFDVIPGN